MISGITAAIGAAWRITKTGRLNHSIARESPIQIPKPTPMIPQIVNPISRGCNVEAYALRKLPSPIIRRKAIKVRLNDGNAALRGQRPTSSQTPKKKAKEAASRRSS